MLCMSVFCCLPCAARSLVLCFSVFDVAVVAAAVAEFLPGIIIASIVRRLRVRPIRPLQLESCCYV